MKLKEILEVISLIQESKWGKIWFIDPRGVMHSPKPSELTHEEMTERIFGKFIDAVDFHKMIYPKGWLRANFYKGTMGIDKGTKKVNSNQYRAIEIRWRMYKAKNMYVDIDTTGGAPSSTGPMDLQQFREKYL